MDGVEDVLLGVLAVHRNLIFFIAHLVKCVVSQVAFTARSHKPRLLNCLFLLALGHFVLLLIGGRYLPREYLEGILGLPEL